MQKLHLQLRRFLHDRQGIAALEFALIAPFLLLLYFGTVDLANWYMTHRRIVLAGSTIADITTQSPGTVKSTDIFKYWNGVGDIIAPLTPSDIAMTIRNYRKDGSTAKRQWTYSYKPAGTAPARTCGSDATAAKLLAIAGSEMTEGNDILVADLCFTTSPIVLQIFGWTAIPLHYQISMRPRLGKTLDCTGCT